MTRTEAAPWRQWGDDIEPESIRQMERACSLPIAVRGFLDAPTHDSLKGGGIKEAPVACVAPIVVTAAGCVVLFLFPDLVYQFSSIIMP